MDSGQLQSKEIKPFLLWDIGSIHEVIYVLTAVAIAIQQHATKKIRINQDRSDAETWFILGNIKFFRSRLA